MQGVVEEGDWRGWLKDGLGVGRQCQAQCNAHGGAIVLTGTDSTLGFQLLFQCFRRFQKKRTLSKKLSQVRLVQILRSRYAKTVRWMRWMRGNEA